MALVEELDREYREAGLPKIWKSYHSMMFPTAAVMTTRRSSLGEILGAAIGLRGCLVGFDAFTASAT